MANEEDPVMFRHFDRLFWTVTSIFVAAIAVFASANLDMFLTDLLALFLTSCFLYFSISFRRLAKNKRGNRKEKFYPLQTGVYVLMMAGIMLFFIYRLNLKIDLYHNYCLIFIAIILPFIAGLIDTVFRGDFKK